MPKSSLYRCLHSVQSFYPNNIAWFLRYRIILFFLHLYLRGWTGGRPLPLPPPYLLPPAPSSPSSLLERRASRAQNFPLFPSLPFFLPSPSSRPLFSPLLPPPAPTSSYSLLLISPSPPSSPLPLTLSTPPTWYEALYSVKLCINLLFNQINVIYLVNGSHIISKLRQDYLQNVRPSLDFLQFLKYRTKTI